MQIDNLENLSRLLDDAPTLMPALMANVDRLELLSIEDLFFFVDNGCTKDNGGITHLHLAKMQVDFEGDLYELALLQRLGEWNRSQNDSRLTHLHLGVGSLDSSLSPETDYVHIFDTVFTPSLSSLTSLTLQDEGNQAELSCYSFESAEHFFGALHALTSLTKLTLKLQRGQCGLDLGYLLRTSNYLFMDRMLAYLKKHGKLEQLDINLCFSIDERSMPLFEYLFQDGSCTVQHLALCLSNIIPIRRDIHSLKLGTVKLSPLSCLVTNDETIVSSFDHVTHLSFNGTCGLLTSVIRKCPNMRSLQFAMPRSVSNECFNAFLDSLLHNRTLQHLYIAIHSIIDHRYDILDKVIQYHPSIKNKSSWSNLALPGLWSTTAAAHNNGSNLNS
ncbi:hypothetical protein SAMD00019534_085090 [Acytostelium subglobosum LB1]|uniref:hypothetical protein n=1 Tax=Acytostelium subglobosum LB1 TaxID=1410327 RepID=UPI000644A3F0|nr:hypothetical protein SAMD00019534_085090 [Acytostelium subglobosum LB1]GAM25334.1 hypothetical protein SAMD00019534_085090 [Acytostelium subglobosum LB1]|eukprot:XP_012751854.1 hypothetical protein SAMD00019534_085090 [Acytostelium subglobosum LB1]